MPLRRFVLVPLAELAPRCATPCIAPHDGASSRGNRSAQSQVRGWSSRSGVRLIALGELVKIIEIV